MKYVDMVLHESAANAGFECHAKVCEGCGKKIFVVEIAFGVTTGVCRDISKFVMCIPGTLL